MADGVYVVKSVNGDGSIAVQVKTNSADEATTLFLGLLESHGLTLDHPALNIKLLMAYLRGEKLLEFHSTTNVVSITLP